MTRSIILHYHLFKNAGTSVDVILKNSFQERYEEREFEKNSIPYSDKVKNWVISSPSCIAFSSHTARMPLPDINDVNVLPIIFVRHPLLRAYSGYIFERRQNIDTFGSKLASEVDFPTYLKVRISRRSDGSVENFQARRFAEFFSDDYGTFHMRACRASKELPLIGLVDSFELSMRKYAQIASDIGLEIKLDDLDSIHANRSNASEMSLSERLEFVESLLPQPLHKQFYNLNKTDLTIYNAVKRRYET